LNSSSNKEYFRKTFVENLKTNIYLQYFFFPENRAVYEIMWKNMVNPDRQQITKEHGEFTLNVL